MKKLFETIARWTQRCFQGGSRSLDKEGFIAKTDSPGKRKWKRFFSRKLAVFALVLLLAVFALVFVGPVFYPLNKGYHEPTQTNVKPGMSLMKVPNSLAGRVKEISSVSRFSVGLSLDGKVSVWGDTQGRAYDMRRVPSAVTSGPVAHAAAGYDHAIAITQDGKVYGWGQNANGQYGAPPEDNAAVQFLYTWAPSEVLQGFASGEVVEQVVCGYQVTAIVLKNGDWFVWGNQSSGALNLSALKRETAGKKVKKVQFTSTNGIVLLEDGSVATASEAFRYVRTENGLVELKDHLAKKNQKVVDIATTSNTVALLLENGEIVFSGSATYGEDAPPTLKGEKIRSLAGGLKHYVAVTDKGRVYAWGDNVWKQASAPQRVNDVEKVFAGPFQNYAVTAAGKLAYKWGLKGYPMGTDGFGRDVWNRLVNGGRMTMTIGAISVLISSAIGITVGCLSGYFGGWVDNALMRFTEIVSSVPFLPFAMILSVVVQTTGMGETARIVMIMVILGLLSWTGLARLVRGQVLAEREKEFVLAAKAMGVKEGKIAFRHILPNIVSVVIVSMTLDFAGCMLIESSLSYLGFGVRGSPTWGNMLSGANSSIVIRTYWWQWVFPSLFLALATVCINVIGDALRDAMDPKSFSGR